jgi:hypothetical protein
MLPTMKKAMTSSRSSIAHWIASLLLVALPLTGNAHQQKSAVTRVLFNPNTNNIEVMHRFFLHDAEHAASQIFGERLALMESSESRELFGNYVINRFAMEATYASGDTRTLALEYVGEEVDGQFIWVYQEIAADADITALAIINLALRDVWSDQTNLVNIERDGEVYSLTFTGSDEMLRVELGA